MTSLTKKTQPPSKKFFFECRLEDLPCLLTLQPCPLPVQEQRYSRAKPRAFRRFFFQKSPKAAGHQSVSSCDVSRKVISAQQNYSPFIATCIVWEWPWFCR